MTEYVPACPKCRRPFVETRDSAKWRRAHPTKKLPEEQEVREGRCEQHDWQQYAT